MVLLIDVGRVRILLPSVFVGGDVNPIAANRLLILSFVLHGDDDDIFEDNNDDEVSSFVSTVRLLDPCSPDGGTTLNELDEDIPPKEDSILIRIYYAPPPFYLN